MDERRINILLISADPTDCGKTRAMLALGGNQAFDVQWADCLLVGLQQLAAGGLDLVLLDLTEEQGIETFRKASEFAREVPIIVVSSLHDEGLAVRIVVEGAQDYLVKNYLTGQLLRRAVRYAIERHRMQTALQALSLIDELTGLYNRRRFQALAEQQFRLADRANRQMALLFVDVDGLKDINDNFGHEEGDWDLLEGARMLKDTFRASDIVARLGGDEFAVLLTCSSANEVELASQRLQANLAARNAKSKRPYALSLSVGTAVYYPGVPCSLGALQARADALMYEQKRKKKSSAAYTAGRKRPGRREGGSCKRFSWWRMIPGISS